MAGLRVVHRAGPLVIARGVPPYPPPNTLVWIGPHRIPGQVMHREGPDLLIFVCGVPEVAEGHEVVAFGRPPAVWAGPGWLHRVHELRFPLQTRPGWGPDSLEIVAWPPEDRRFPVHPRRQPGDAVAPHQELAVIPEASRVRHSVKAPAPGRLQEIRPQVSPTEPVAWIHASGSLMPVYAGRLVPLHHPPSSPRLWIQFQPTGVPVLDLFFPLTAGGMALLTGPQGVGKTALLNHVAQFGDHDLVVYLADRRKRHHLEALAEQVPGVYLVAQCEGTYRGEFLALVGRALAEYYRQLGLRVLQITDASCEWLETMGALWQALEETGHASAQEVVLERVAQCLGAPLLERRDPQGPRVLTHLLATRQVLEDLPDPLVALIFDRVRTLWRLDPQTPVFPPLRWTASYATHAEILQQQTERWVDEEFPEQLREIRRLMEHYESLTLEGQGIRRPEDHRLAVWVQRFQRHFWHIRPGVPPLPLRRAAWFLRLLFLLWDWSRTVQQDLQIPEDRLEAVKQQPLETPEGFQQAWDALLRAVG